MIAISVIAHRMGQASLLLKIVFAPIAQLGNSVLGKKIGCAAKRGQLPQRRLGAILAKFKGVVVSGFGLRAGHAHKALRLVLPHQGFECSRCVPFLSEYLGDSFQGSPPTSGPIIFRSAAIFLNCGIFSGHDTVLLIASHVEQLQRAVGRRVPVRRSSRTVLCSFDRNLLRGFANCTKLYRLIRHAA